MKIKLLVLVGCLGMLTSCATYNGASSYYGFKRPCCKSPCYKPRPPAVCMKACGNLYACPPCDNYHQCIDVVDKYCCVRYGY